ncbi:MAG: hypothetical protein AAFY57_20235 [Cyanobacteria bacterium J06642_2]
MYDAWAIRKGWERGWFDTHRYKVMYSEKLDVAATQSPPHKRTKKVVPPSTSSSEEEQPDDRQSTPAKGSRRTRPPRLVSSSDSIDYSLVASRNVGRGRRKCRKEKQSMEHVTKNAIEGDGGEKEHVEEEDKVSEGGGGGEKEHVEVQVSFDVVNLYPSVPIKEAIDIVTMMLKSDASLKQRTKLTVDDIKQLNYAYPSATSYGMIRSTY